METQRRKWLHFQGRHPGRTFGWTNHYWMSKSLSGGLAGEREAI